jgi:preprotein translocase subunit SecG
MFDLIDGLPWHPLVVHAVVVLLPLAVLGTIAIVVRPVWRQRYGHLVLAAAAVGTALLPVATSSGEALEKHVGDPGEHAELGDSLIWFALPLVVLLVALLLLDRRERRATGSAGASTSRDRVVSERGASTLLVVVAALSLVSAVAVGVQVYRVGESGARAAWGDQVSAAPAQAPTQASTQAPTHG